MKIISRARTDPGNIRPRNEDSLLNDDQHGLYAVADGLGGHAHGEVASRMAIEALAAALSEQESAAVKDRVSTAPHPADRTTEQTLLARAFADANTAIFNKNKAAGIPALSGMGTTLTALFLNQRTAFIAHVGDSRAYLFRNGVCRQLTRDHALVAEYVRSGVLTPDEARTHPYRHVITRALGLSAQVEVDEQSLALFPNDVFLLCTDGLTEQVLDEEISAALNSAWPAAAADDLVHLAKERGGVDNITVVVAQAVDED